MEKTAKKVDGFRFLPPGLAAWIQTYIPEEEFNGPIPWTPLAKPLIVTSYVKRKDRSAPPLVSWLTQMGPTARTHPTITDARIISRIGESRTGMLGNAMAIKFLQNNVTAPCKTNVAKYTQSTPVASPPLALT